jgi:hypothetical protein
MTAEIVGGADLEQRLVVEDVGRMSAATPTPLSLTA